MATFEERYAKFAAEAKKQAPATNALEAVKSLAESAKPAQPEQTSPERAELPMSGKLDALAKAQIEMFMKSGDLPAMFNLVEHLMKYDRKLTTLLNSAAFEDEVKKVFRRQFQRRVAVGRRLTDTQPGAPLSRDSGTRSGNGTQTMPGVVGRLGLIFIDLDDFKRLNDTKGHLAGDAALHAVERVLNEGLREHDIKGRFGGEELVVAIEMENEGDQFIVGEKLVRLIRATDIEYGGEHLRVTASIGSAELQPGETYEELVDRANWAMKFAKGHGKDKAIPAELDEVKQWIAQKKGTERRSEPR